MVQYQILQTNITRTVWQTVRRITNEILGVKSAAETLAVTEGLIEVIAFTVKILTILLRTVNNSIAVTGHFCYG